MKNNFHQLKNLSSTLNTEGNAIRLLYFVVYASGAAWYPIFNVYLKERGLTGIQIGTVASVLPAMYLICQPFWGMGADRWGRHRSLLLAMFASAFLMIGFVASSTFWYYFFWTILFAFFFNPVSPLIDSVTLDYVETSGKSSYGLMRMWGAIGWALFAPIVGYIITGRDSSLIFPIGAGLLLLGWLVRVKTNYTGGTGTGMEVTWQNLGGVIRNLKLIIFLILIFITSIGTTAIWTFYSVYLHDIGASRQLIGIAFAIDGISEIPFYLISVVIIKRIGLTRTLVITFFISALRIFLYSIISSPIIAVAMEISHGLSFALFLVAAVEYANYLVPPTWRATGQSLLWAAYFGAGSILGNTWAGFLYDRLGVHMLFRVNGWIILGVAIIAVFAFRERRSKVNEESI